MGLQICPTEVFLNPRKSHCWPDAFVVTIYATCMPYNSHTHCVLSDKDMSVRMYTFDTRTYGCFLAKDCCIYAIATLRTHCLPSP